MTPEEALNTLDKTVIRNLELKIVLSKAVEKQIPKKVIHIHQEYEKHDWYKNDDGTVDVFHFEYEHHSGVQCKRCWETVCTLCHEDYDEEAGKCVIDEHLCPSCKKYIAKHKYCPDCGQALDWSDNK